MHACYAERAASMSAGWATGRDWHACASINLTRVICVSVTVHLYQVRLLISVDVGRDTSRDKGWAGILGDII